MYVLHEHKYIIVRPMEETTGVEVQKNKGRGGNDRLEEVGSVKMPDFSITGIIDSGLKSSPERYTLISPIQSPISPSGRLFGTNSQKTYTNVLEISQFSVDSAINGYPGAENGR
jgi:hypothetical protein